MAMQANIFPPTLSAGDPWTVPSSTFGSARPSRRTVSKPIFFRGIRTHYGAGDRTVGASHAAAVAQVARQTPCIESRRLARVPQTSHEREVDPIRRLGARGAVLRMDRQSHQTIGRGSLRAQVHPAKADEQMVGH